MHVGCDLAQECGRDIVTCVKRDCGAATVRMSELLVRATLPDFRKTVSLEQSDDLPGLEDRQGAQSQATWTVRASTNSDSRVG